MRRNDDPYNRLQGGQPLLNIRGSMFLLKNFTF